MNNNQIQAQENNSMMIIEGLKLDRVSESMKKINEFQEVIQKTLVPNHDYGQAFFGSGKPSLLKPGAEKILMLLGLASQYEIIEKIQDYDEGFFAYTIRCILTKNGIVVTEGLGHCNSKEKKYESDKQDKYMLGNTCLKMAKKRAQVDAALTVGSLSNIFTQDLEDMVQFEQTERVETMNEDDAENVRIGFGKYRGKTLGGIYEMDAGYVKWLADKAKDPAMRKAAAIILDKGKQVEVQTTMTQPEANTNSVEDIDNYMDEPELPWDDEDDKNIPF